MSMKFDVMEKPAASQTHTLWRLCEYLTNKVVVPFLDAHGTHYDARFQEFFTHHWDSNPFEATGTIEFYPPPLFLGELNDLEDAIRCELNMLGIIAGSFRREDYPNRLAVRVIYLPVLQNPTAESGPPEVSMSETKASLVLRDLLGFEPAKNGRYDLSAEQIKKRLAGINDQSIEKCCERPVRESRPTCMVRRVSSPITVKSVRRCLKELDDLATWMSRHGYQQVSAAKTTELEIKPKAL